MSKTRILSITKQQSVRNPSGGTGNPPTDLQGNGNDDHAPIGLWQGDVYRDFVKPDVDWTGVYQIVKAWYDVTTTDQVHVGFGANPKVSWRPLGAAFSSSGGSENGWNASAPTPWDTQEGSPHDTAVLTSVENKAESFDITDYYERIAPATVLKRDGNPGDALPNHGFRIVSANEGSNANTWETYSIRGPSGKRPSVRLIYDDNNPPLAPLISSPAAAGSTDPTLAPTTAGTEVVVQGTHQDPDNDTSQYAATEVWTASTQDGASGGPPTGGSLVQSNVAIAVLAGFSVTVPLLAARTAYTQRTRTKDSRGAWGAWTALDSGHFKTAYQPLVPQNPYVDASLLVPTFAASISSQDSGEFATAMQVLVYDDTQPGSDALWDSGKVEVSGSPVRPTLTYAGPDLREDLEYRYQVVLWNRDDVPTPSTGDLFFTIHLPTGPTITPGDTSTKQDDTTPAFTVLFAAVIDQYELEVYRVQGTPRQVLAELPEGSALLYDKAPTSVPPATLATSAAADDIIDTTAAHGFVVDQAVQFTALTGGAGLSVGTTYYVIAANLGSTTFQVSTTKGGSAVNFTTDITAGTVAALSVIHSPTTALPNATVVHIRAAGRPNGGSTMGPWSSLYPVYINALANAPTVSFEHTDGTAGVVQADGSVVVPLPTGTTVRIRAPFSDPDLGLYTESASKRTIEVRNAATPQGSGSHVTGSPREDTSGIGATYDWATGLTIESSYDVRVKHADTSGTYGPNSAWKRTKISRPPTVSLTAPSAGATVADPTPLVDWAYSSSGGKAQKRKRVRIYRQIPG